MLSSIPLLLLLWQTSCLAQESSACTDYSCYDTPETSSSSVTLSSSTASGFPTYSYTTTGDFTKYTVTKGSSSSASGSVESTPSSAFVTTSTPAVEPPTTTPMPCTSTDLWTGNIFACNTSLTYGAQTLCVAPCTSIGQDQTLATRLENWRNHQKNPPKVVKVFRLEIGVNSSATESNWRFQLDFIAGGTDSMSSVVSTWSLNPYDMSKTIDSPLDVPWPEGEYRFAPPEYGLDDCTFQGTENGPGEILCKLQDQVNSVCNWYKKAGKLLVPDSSARTYAYYAKVECFLAVG